MHQLRAGTLRNVCANIQARLAKGEISDPKMRHLAETTAERGCNILNYQAVFSGLFPLPPDTQIPVPDDLLEKISILTGISRS